MNRSTVPLVMAFLFFWVPLLHFFPCADAFLLPKDLAALVLSVLLALLLVFRSPVTAGSAFFPLLILFLAWMVGDGWVVGYSSTAVLQASIHLILWIGAFSGLLLLGEGGVDKTAFFVLAAGALMALHGILQSLGLWEGDWTTRFEGRAFSTLGNPDHLGGFLGALLPLAWILTLRAKDLKGWWSFRAVTLLLFAGLLATRARGPFVALGVAALFMAGMMFFSPGKELVGRNKGSVWLTLGVAVAGAAAFWLRHGGWRAFGPGQESFRQRWDLAQVAWAMAKDHPWTGVGLGHFALLFPRYQAVPWSNGGHPYFYSSHVHNEYLQFLAEGGVIALALFLLLLAVFARGLVRYWKDPLSTESGKTLLIGVAGGMIALLVQSLANFPLQVAPTALLFGFYLAAPWALSSRAQGVPQGFPGVGKVLALVLLLVVGGWSVRAFAASIALRDTLGEAGLGNGAKASYYAARLLFLSPSDPKALGAAARAFRLNGQGAEADAVLKKALDLDPNDLDDRVAAAKSWLERGKPMEAVPLCERVLAVAPNDLDALWTLAVGSFQSGDLTKAAKGFEDYAALSPNEYQTYLNLGVCYMRLGEKEKAKTAWEKAKALNPGDPQTESYLKSLNRKTKTK